MPRKLFACLAAIALACPAWADSWGPYESEHETDSTGRYAVDLEGIDYGIKGATFVFRDRDTVLAKGTLPFAPLNVVVSSQGLGFAAICEHGGVGSGVTFVWVSREGKLLHAKKLPDLFSENEIQGFTHTVSSIGYYVTAWVDEPANRVVLVGAGYLIRTIDLKTGEVGKGDAEVLKQAILLEDPQARASALQIAARMKLDPGAKEVGAILDDGKAPLSVRLRAAVSLAVLGDRKGSTLILKTATDSALRKEERAYAVKNLPECLGEASIPVLCRLYKETSKNGQTPEFWTEILNTFPRLGEAAIPALLEMMDEPGASADYRGGAAHMLGSIPSKKALPNLLKTIADPSDYVANAAANAAIALGGAGILADLTALLDRGTTQDDRIAMFLKETKHPPAVPSLVKALERHREDPRQGGFARSCIVEALEFQTGQRLGADPGAWKAWCKEHWKTD